MAKLYYEDAEVGTEITPLVKKPTTRHLVKWAGATGDYNEPHYDEKTAKAWGLPGVIIHGLLKQQFLIQMLTDWMGLDGDLLKLNVKYRGMDFPGDALSCAGKVIRKFTEGPRLCVECEIAINNQRGERNTAGTAVVALPSRDAADRTRPDIRPKGQDCR